MKMRGDWVLPILEDLRDFAGAADLPDLSHDLAAVLEQHRDSLRTLGEEPIEDVPDNVVRLFDTGHTPTPTTRSRAGKPS